MAIELTDKNLHSSYKNVKLGALCACVHVRMCVRMCVYVCVEVRAQGTDVRYGREVRT